MALQRRTPTSADQRGDVVSQPPFHHRDDAGDRLAELLVERLAGPLAEEASGMTPDSKLLVLALSKGGMRVGRRVADALGAPLDVFIVRRLSIPDETDASEVTLGAVASGGVRMLNETVLRSNSMTDDTLARIARDEERKLVEEERRYRDRRPALEIAGRSVVLVDDGAANLSMLRAAAAALQVHEPGRLLVAAPVLSGSTITALGGSVDDVVTNFVAEPFVSPATWYRTFDEVEDEAVRRALLESPSP